MFNRKLKVSLQGVGSPIWLYSFSVIYGCALFFNNSQVFDWIRAPYEPVYVGYSQNIFHPDYMARVMYWGESILLPVIANLIGASKSKESFLFLCSVIYLCTLPIFSFLAYKRLNSLMMSFFFIVLLGFSFLNDGGGSPDSLVILLLGIATLSRNYSVIFLAIVASCLAHFSLTFVAVAGLILLIYFSPLPNNPNSKKVIYVYIFGLMMGRGLLELWYWWFDYLNSSGRILYVYELGIDYFWQKYIQSKLSFWIAPGISFITIFMISNLFFLYKKNILFVLTSILSIAIAYIAMFFSLDGYRIFVVSVSASWIYILATFLYALKSVARDKFCCGM